MDATRDYHTNCSKSERERQNIIRYHSYVKSNGTNERIYRTETDSQT